jgi:hypothetical protein
MVRLGATILAWRRLVRRARNLPVRCCVRCDEVLKLDALAAEVAPRKRKRRQSE